VHLRPPYAGQNNGHGVPPFFGIQMRNGIGEHQIRPDFCPYYFGRLQHTDSLTFCNPRVWLRMVRNQEDVWPLRATPFRVFLGLGKTGLKQEIP
jgi:hypothetical protein